MQVSEEILKRGEAALVSGKPLIFPTDTVYGLGLAMGVAPTPQIMYELKKRDYTKPIACLIDSLESLNVYGEDVSEPALRLAKKFWPGPLTLIVEASTAVPATFQAQDGSIALRMPNNTLCLTLIDHIRHPLATTSANISGQKPPTRFKEIDADLIRKVGTAIKDDSSLSGLASTIVDCRKKQVCIIREGEITRFDIEGYE